MRKLILILLYGGSMLLLLEYCGFTNVIPIVHPKFVRTTLTPKDSLQLIQENQVVEKKNEKNKQFTDKSVKTNTEKTKLETFSTPTTPKDSTQITRHFSKTTQHTHPPVGNDPLKKTKSIQQVAPIFEPKDQMPFAVQFKKELSTHPILGIYLMPNEVFSFTIKNNDHRKKDTVWVSNTTNKGELTQKQWYEWDWKAPQKEGIYPLILRQKNTAEAMTLNCFVMIPLEEAENGKLNEYNIGYYPVPKDKTYLPPEGVIEVNKANENTLLSPNYQLKDFLSNQKQKFNYPNYVVLSERLLLKLELLTAVAQHAGIPFQRFTIMSAYRTPYYNTQNKNTKYSRHQWGMASDIFIDANNDYAMDDLNDDGKFNVEDSKVLYDIIDQLQHEAWYQPFLGGMGIYKENTSRTSFVHVDVGRGVVARWEN